MPCFYMDKEGVRIEPFAAKPIHWIGLLLVLIAWFAHQLTWWYAESEKYDLVDSIERVTDATFVTNKEFGAYIPYINWIGGSAYIEDPGEELILELERIGAADYSDADEIISALKNEAYPFGGVELAEYLNRDSPLSEEEQAILEAYYSGVILYSWEADWLRLLFKDEVPDWLTIEFQKRSAMEAWMIHGTIIGAVVTVLVTLSGIPFFRMALKGMILKGHWPVDRPKSGVLLWVLFAFFASDLFVNVAYEVIYSFLGILDYWPDIVDIAIDSEWRLGGVLVLVVLVFPNFSSVWSGLGMGKQVGIRVTLGWIAISLITSSVFYTLISNWADGDIQILWYDDGYLGLFGSVLSSVILAPLCEEVVFRGVLFGVLWNRIGFWPSAVLSSLVFSFVHYYDIGGSIGVFGIGLIACLLYRQTRSLWSPILMHAVYNGLITLAVWPVYNAPYSIID